MRELEIPHFLVFKQKQNVLNAIIFENGARAKTKQTKLNKTKNKKSDSGGRVQPFEKQADNVQILELPE